MTHKQSAGHEDNALLHLAELHFALQFAVLTAVRAICSVQPNREILIAAFRREHEETMGLLLNQKLSQSTIQAYIDYLGHMAPDAEKWFELEDARDSRVGDVDKN